MIPPGVRTLSTVILSTALGPGGRGMFPYTLLPGYRRLLQAVRETGTVAIAKSSTRHPRRGNFVLANPLTWKYIRRLPGLGMLNAYGLTNAGVEVHAPEIATSCRAGFRVIPNFWPELGKGAEMVIRETLEAMAIYRRHLGEAFSALELNLSCPNVPEAVACNLADSLALIREVREAFPDLFLIAKLSLIHPYEFAQELEKLGVGALHAVNTIPYEMVFPPDRFPPSPLAAVGGGGVSGGPAWPLAHRYNTGLRPKVKLPLIMGCGVSSREDVQRYLDIGADAVSICTLALRRPEEAAGIVRHYNA